jgi:hypothetical protein
MTTMRTDCNVFFLGGKREAPGRNQRIGVMSTHGTL